MLKSSKNALNPFALDEISRVYALRDLPLTSYVAKRILSVQQSVRFPMDF